MGQKTDIEWCDSTCNPAMGCDGCELWPGDDAPKEAKRCYAGTLTERYADASKGFPIAFGKPQLFPGRIERALRWPDLTGKPRHDDKLWLDGYPRTIFLGDMGDNFTESLPFNWMAPCVTYMQRSPHIWIMLTKRPARMFQFFQTLCDPSFYRPIPRNFWLLTSVTGPENVGRIYELLKLRALGAKVLGVSYEPAWGAVDFRPFQLDWMIAGGESGPGARPSHPQWFRDVRDQCAEAGVPFFFKQWGEWLPGGQDGEFDRDGSHVLNCGAEPIRVGKRAAGATLDGREHREFPAVAHV